MPPDVAEGMEIRRGEGDTVSHQTVLTPEAMEFLAKLQAQFNPRRLALLEKRHERQQKLNHGDLFHFLPETEQIRKDPSWRVVETHPALQKRWVEITGPTDRKMVINAMNSGADVFMADFEDANTPTWNNIIEGQINLRDTVNQTITFTNPDGKLYELTEKPALLLVRPRGWHLNEKHLLIHGEEISGSLFDFGLYFFHNVKTLLEQKKGPFFYLPKLESHLEARLWNEVFLYAQSELGLPKGTIRATVLLETIPAAFEMEEILYELRDHSAGLNAGRWDYLFSVIKKFQKDPDLQFPDRDQLTMTTPFMRAYTQLLVHTCHKRGAHAIGGMAAFVPNKKDPEVSEKALEKVREDKLREVNDGFDGTWVAHPGLVFEAHNIFLKSLGDRPHQKDKQVIAKVTEKNLLDFHNPNSRITEHGIRHNIDVTLQYLVSWLNGKGAVTIYNLMEDTATAEISRAQLWQWRQTHAKLETGREVSEELLRQFIKEETDKLPKGEEANKATQLLEELVFSSDFIAFLTLPAYKLI